MGKNLFASLPIAVPDAIFAIGQAAKAVGPAAINGTIGIYMDEEGRPMMFPSIRVAIDDVKATLSTRSYSYPPLTGLPEYREAVHRLVLGDAPAANVASIATTGGTGAVAINLRLAKMLQTDPSVIFPTPTWANHKQLCAEAGLRMDECPYLSAPTEGRSQDSKASIDGLMTALKKARSPALVLLHAGCHNPTGLDLTREQWEELLPAIRDANAVALMDFAYQGFAGTPEEDAWPVRRAAELGVTTLACWSASKNHCIYAERAGLALAVTPEPGLKEKVEGHYMTLTRKIHSAAATFGQSVVAQTQKTHREEWLKDIADARTMMKTKRAKLIQLLPEDLRAALSGNGMFAQLALRTEEIDRLKTEHLVFLTGDGRINISGIPLKRIEELAQKIVNVSGLVG